MVRKTLKIDQLNIFNTPNSLFSVNSLKMYSDEHVWHNQFR